MLTGLKAKMAVTYLDGRPTRDFRELLQNRDGVSVVITPNVDGHWHDVVNRIVFFDLPDNERFLQAIQVNFMLLASLNCTMTYNLKTSMQI